MERQPTNEMILVESRSMRDQTIERTHVLDKVKTLITLPDSFHVTTPMVASYFEVPLSTIDSLVQDNRAELEERGYRVLRGTELTEFATPFGGVANLGLHYNARSLALFPRKAVLNVGQLLTKSEVSKEIRTYLLDVEERQTNAFQIPASFAEALELAAAQARELEQAQAALAEAAPKIEAHDNLIQYGPNRTVGEVAKELSTPERNIMVSELRRLIVHEWKWAFVKTRECGSAQYTPYAHKTDYLALGEEKYPHETRPDCWHATMRITPKGREAIRRKLDREKAQASIAQLAPPAPSADEISTMIRRGA
ncbi:phage antirepressor KilAC domain-containing protein [Streptomyces maoxianensis]|uniref:Phage antirepressor KilAC domain-containing protein n=1 Tax=Streptomyces maoxianensis TaxID=1459942 RepID=A0ABV9G724_9ACTN